MLGHVAVGTWSGGRFMRFGEPISDERLEALLRPGDGIDTLITADAYGAGEADSLLGRALAGVPRADYALVGAVGPRLLRGRARRRQGLPALHRPAPARPGRLRRLPAHGSRAQPRALRRRLLRPAAAAQPRPARLRVPRGLGGAARAARRGPGARARPRPRPGQRLHARRDRLLRALRRADRLGDADPQPVRALARRAGARRRRAPRREGDHARGRLRRPLPRRRAPRARASSRTTTAASGPRAGSRPAASGSSGSGRSPTATGSRRSSSRACGTSPTTPSSAWRRR